MRWSSAAGGSPTWSSCTDKRRQVQNMDTAITAFLLATADDTTSNPRERSMQTSAPPQMLHEPRDLPIGPTRARQRINVMKKFSFYLLFAACVAAVPLMSLAAQPETQAPVASAAPLPADITSHVTATYVRVILPMSQAEPLVQQYTEKLKGRVVYDFDFPAIKSRVVGLESPHGNLSAIFTDDFQSYDDFRKNTRLMYVVDDVQATLDAAERSGLKIVQKFARTPVAWQGRFEVVPGFVIEIVKFFPKQ